MEELVAWSAKLVGLMVRAPPITNGLGRTSAIKDRFFEVRIVGMKKSRQGSPSGLGLVLRKNYARFRRRQPTPSRPRVARPSVAGSGMKVSDVN